MIKGTLIEFVQSDLSNRDKQQLYSNKVIALSLFRMALTPVEQQMMYHLLFIDPDEQKGISPKEMAEQYLQTPGSNLLESTESKTDVTTSTIDTSTNFFKKLLDLDLVVESQVDARSETDLSSLPQLTQPSSSLPGRPQALMPTIPALQPRQQKPEMNKE